MAQLQRSDVTLRICGDDLVPDEITALLRVSPTVAEVKGQEIVGRKTGNIRIAKSGLWLLRAATREPGDMDGQIHELLKQMTTDLAIWRSIANRFRVDLFCSLSLRGRNEGLILSPHSLFALGARGIEMGLDIYSGDEDEETSA